MKYSLSQLEASSKAQRGKHQAQRDEKARAEAEAARVRLTPLDERLTRLLATIPLEMQREGLLLAALQASLRGRRRGNCHPGELGNAMRKLQSVRRRNWPDGAGFQALWFPARGRSLPAPVAAVQTAKSVSVSGPPVACGNEAVAATMTVV